MRGMIVVMFDLFVWNFLVFPQALLKVKLKVGVVGVVEESVAPFHTG
jgi:hypothetical protein